MVDIIRPGSMNSYDDEGAFLEDLHRFRYEITNELGVDHEELHQMGPEQVAARAEKMGVFLVERRDAEAAAGDMANA